ncbi:MAG TPA: hypothetical protein VG454_01805 [Gemmatimonadales bacterium]|nr:hypothetical protein [Gemmatimonadales bacterium]
MTILALALLAPLSGHLLLAQEKPPARPVLAATADTNDWEAYYDAGVDWLNQRQQMNAEAAFYWASRLEPRRAEPLFARWATAWARDNRRFERYLERDPNKPLPPEMLRIDSLRYRALLRNPLVFQGLIIAAYQELPGHFADDAWTHAMVAYAMADFHEALTFFGHALDRDPARYANEVRYLRATTYVAIAQYDSAAAELDSLIASLQRRDAERLTPVYQSKALLYYARGLLQSSRQDAAGARAGFESALVEDLSFYPAHIALGQLRFGQRDLAGALKEFEQGAALGVNDPVAHYEYGAALARAQRSPEATTELRAAIALEPYFADPYYWLGEALLAQQDSAAARTAYQDYLARASAKSGQLAAARAKLAALRTSREE